MLSAASALAFLSAAVLAPPAQVPRQSVPRLEPFERQLGAVHFPGGEAALRDSIACIEVLPSGAVIVAGSTYGSLGEAHAGPSSHTDLFVARFGDHGNLEWIRQVGAVTAPTIPALNGAPLGPGGQAIEFEFAGDLAVAPDGSIFVTGWTRSSLGETCATGTDIFVAKLDASGTLLWLRQLGVQTAATIVPEPGATQWGEASGNEWGVSILVHPSGDFFVGGSTTSALSEDPVPFTEDFFLARFDGTGVLQWVRQIGQISGPAVGFPADQYDACDSIALHPSGKIVLAGTSSTATGTLFIERGHIFLFDDAGHPLDWEGIGTTSRIDGMAIHETSGQILVGGGVFTWMDQPLPSDVFAACFDANLVFLWSRRVDASTTSHLGLIDLGGHESVSSVALDRAGNLVLAGVTDGSLNEPNGGGFDIFTARIRRTDGIVLSVNQIGQTTAAAMGLQVNSDEGVGSNGLALGPVRRGRADAPVQGGALYLGGATWSRFAEPRGGLSDALLLRLDSYGRLR